MTLTSLDGWAFPGIALDLHHSRLLVREGNLAFFVEAILLQISNDPKKKVC